MEKRRVKEKGDKSGGLEKKKEKKERYKRRGDKRER